MADRSGAVWAAAEGMHSLSRSSLDRGTGPGAATPYLTASLSIIQTLEKEIRASALPGSREEISADALALRGTELHAQIARLEIEARNSVLEQMLPVGQSTSQVQKASRTAQMSALTAKLAQAERDVKAYKSRVRQQDAQIERNRELTARVASLEHQLLAADGTNATQRVEMEELRRRAVVAEATCDALREELQRDQLHRGDGKEREAQLSVRVTELEQHLQRVQLERATMERKAEICEAELVVRQEGRAREAGRRRGREGEGSGRSLPA